VTEQQTAPDHFKGCHSEDKQAPEAPERHRPTDPEDCWHCGDTTPRGCFCPDCLDSDEDIPAEMVYHCKTCGRWWSYIYLRIIEMIQERIKP